MIYIGIDPSINSSGIWVSTPSEEHSFVICGKITKRQKLAQEQISGFNYVLYEKTELNGIEDTHVREAVKTFNFMNICDAVKSIVDKFYNSDTITIVMEGISYGSLKTVSVFDLAGLNYLLRNTLYGYQNVSIYICPPSEIKKFATGVGNAKKELIIESFKKIYPNYEIIPKVDDISDAYFMCEYAKKLVKEQSKSN